MAEIYLIGTEVSGAINWYEGLNDTFDELLNFGYGMNVKFLGSLRKTDTSFTLFSH